MLFVKHTDVQIWNCQSRSLQKFSQFGTKYTLAHATADRNHIYAATVDNGVIIMVRNRSVVRLLIGLVLELLLLALVYTHR